MTPRDTLVKRFLSIKVWKKGRERAPHKPLLILLSLARLQGGIRWLNFAAASEPLKGLIEKYGPERAAYHSEFPFWRLRNDKGNLWELHGGDGFAHLQDSVQPSEDELLRHNVRGGFTQDVYSALRNNPDWVIDVASAILSTHFPGTLHADIAKSVGLDLTSSGSTRR